MLGTANKDITYLQERKTHGSPCWMRQISQKKLVGISGFKSSFSGTITQLTCCHAKQLGASHWNHAHKIMSQPRRCNTGVVGNGSLGKLYWQWTCLTYEQMGCGSFTCIMVPDSIVLPQGQRVLESTCGKPLGLLWRANPNEPTGTLPIPFIFPYSILVAKSGAPNRRNLSMKNHRK